LALDNTPKSPCIGVCSTGIGDTVCRGCKRFTHEVISWNAYSRYEKQAILNRLSSLARQVVEPVIVVEDKKLLLSALKFQHLRVDECAGEYLWLLELLKRGSSQLQSLDTFGCRIEAGFKGQNLYDLKNSIDEDFFVLSTVHYERYFLRAEPRATT
jgi:predicted Fe-S protein YdhL (DUF1289 family)